MCLHGPTPTPDVRSEDLEGAIAFQHRTSWSAGISEH